jgi:hypothetical protein
MFLLSASAQDVRKGNVFGVATKPRDGRTTVQISLVVEGFLTYKSLKLSLVPTQLPIRWVTVFFPRGKEAGTWC